MAVLKCKMCGGDLDVGNETTVVECEYCGTKQPFQMRMMKRK